MDYKKHYNTLMHRGQSRLLEEYQEKHRIIPGCMEGTYDSHNVVMLTPEEHYTAHLLLCKIYPSHSGLAHAANMMGGTRPGNKAYGWIRRRHAKAMSERMLGKNKGLTYEEIYGPEKAAILREIRSTSLKGRTGYKHTKEARQKMSEAKKGVAPPNKGKRMEFAWWTNGEEEKFFRLKDQPDNWVRGRMPNRTWMTNRKLARYAGSKTYQGKGCARGHNIRYVSTGQCIECLKDYTARRYRAAAESR